VPSTRFHLVDVFATERYAGNQLAVVEDPRSLTDERMGALAAEFDFSETTFVSLDGEPYHTRIFTPREEIPFAGHPTLGTAWVVRERAGDDLDGAVDEVVLDLPVGEIPVDVRPTDGAETLWMRQPTPTFGERRSHERAAAVLGLPVDALDRTLPVQAVSTGLPTVVVPVRDREALTGIDVDRAAYDAFVADHEAKNVLAFCADPREARNDLAVRVFAPYYGVPEDPATGSSNGCLAGYLARHRADGDVSVRVEQGYEMGRPSLLCLDARGGTDADDGIEVEVGGRVVPVGSGTLR
jgi:trans-2,3-dihydro-3-hydroxyanthranilate isomerase